MSAAGPLTHKILHLVLQDQKSFARFVKLLRQFSRFTGQNSCMMQINREQLVFYLRDCDETECKMALCLTQSFFSRYKFAREGTTETREFLLGELRELAAFLELYKGRSCEFALRISEVPQSHISSHWSDTTTTENRGLMLEAQVKLESGMFEFSTSLMRAKAPIVPAGEYPARVAAKRLPLVQLSTRQSGLLDMLRGGNIVFEFKATSLELSSTADPNSILALTPAQFKDYDSAVATRVLKEEARLAFSHSFLQGMMGFCSQLGATHVPVLTDHTVRNQALKVYFAVEGENMSFAARKRTPLVRSERSDIPRVSQLQSKPQVQPVLRPVLESGPRVKVNPNLVLAAAKAEGSKASNDRPAPRVASAAQNVHEMNNAPQTERSMPTPSVLRLGTALTPPPRHALLGEDAPKPSERLITVGNQSYLLPEKYAKLKEENEAKLSAARNFFSSHQSKN